MFIKLSSKSVPSIVSIFAICLTLSACGAHYGAAKFVSDPPGAEVTNADDGTVIGITPVTMFWKDSSGKRQHPAIRLKKDGYHEKISSFWLSMRHKNQEDAIENAQLVEVKMQKRGE